MTEANPTAPAATQPTTPPASVNAAPGQATPTVPSGAAPVTPVTEPVKPPFPPTSTVPSYRVKEEADKRRAAEARVVELEQKLKATSTPVPTGTPAPAQTQLSDTELVLNILDKAGLDPANLQNQAFAYKLLRETRGTAATTAPTPVTPTPTMPEKVTGNETVAELKAKIDAMEARLSEERVAQRLGTLESQVTQEFGLDKTKFKDNIIDQAGKELAGYLANLAPEYQGEDRWNAAHAFMRERIPKIKAGFDSVIEAEVQARIQAMGQNFNNSPRIPGFGAPAQVEPPDPNRELFKAGKISERDYNNLRMAQAWEKVGQGK